MSVVYFNDHSITFLFSWSGTTVNGYRRSWYDLGLIPAKRPSVAASQPRLKLISIPGSNKKLDLTDTTPGGLTFGRRTGQWEFYIDTSKWNSLAECIETLGGHFNGNYMAVVLEDDHSHYYAGRLTLTDVTNDGGQPKVTINYELYYQVGNNNFIYNPVPALVRIISSLMPSHPSFVLGEEIDEVRKWITTIAQYDNGKSEYVDIDNLGSEIFTVLGSRTIPTRYKNFTSSVTINVVEDTIIGLVGIRVTSYTNYFRLGASKDNIRDRYNFYKKYENGYIATNYSQTIDYVDGVFSELGTNIVNVESEGIEGSVEAIAYKVFYIEPYFETNNAPEYMRVGDFKRRLTYFSRARGYTNIDGQVFIYSYLKDNEYKPTIENTRFNATGLNSFMVNVSNLAYDPYNETVTGYGSIEIREAFDIIDSWNTVNEAITNGTYRTLFKIGDMVKLEIPNLYNGYAQIVGIDMDYDEDNDIIPITWMLKESLYSTKAYNSTYTRTYMNSELKTYVNSLETELPSVLQNMLKVSQKEILYYNSGIKYEVNLLKLWIPSGYETGLNLTTKHDFNNRDINYHNFFSNRTERIKYRNSNSISTYYQDPHSWFIRDVAYNDSSSITLVSEYGRSSYSSPSVKRDIIFGFCTDAIAYDENLDWVVRKFKALIRTLNIYMWNTFGLSENSNNNTTYSAVENELPIHIITSDEPSSRLSEMRMPYVMVGLTSETETNYIYQVTLVDHSSTSEFVTSFISKFNMTVDRTIIIDWSTGDVEVWCTMTTNKLLNE